MHSQRRIWIGIVLLVSATALAAICVEYKVEPIRFAPGSHDYVLASERLIVPLGLTGIDPPPSSLLAKYHGKTEAQRGLFARNGFSTFVATVGGLLVPLSLSIFGIYLFVKALTRRPGTT